MGQWIFKSKAKRAVGAVANAALYTVGGVAMGAGAGWGLFWKKGRQYDEKSAEVSNLVLHVPDHDTFMSAMLCRLMYTFDGRLLKINDTAIAYPSLEELRKRQKAGHIELTTKLDQWPVVLCAGDVDMEKQEVEGACTTLTAHAEKRSKKIQVADMKDWQEGDFLMIYYPSGGHFWDPLTNKSEKVQITKIEKAEKAIHLESSLNSAHNVDTQVYKIRKYVEILYFDCSRKYVEFEPGKFEMVPGNKVDILPFIKTELVGLGSESRGWFHRAMFYPGGALSPSFCSVIAADGHEGARRARVSDTASTRAGESCEILCHDEAKPERAWKVMFENGQAHWFQETEILDVTEPGPAPVTMWIAWQGSMFDKRVIDAFTDLGCAPVKAEVWCKQFPDLWVHSAMYSKVQSDAVGQKDIILHLVQAYDVKRIVFCGHSLGGGLARIAHVYTLAMFHEMTGEEKTIVGGVDVQSITWAAPMVLFEQEKPKTGRRKVPLTLKDKAGKEVVQKWVPMTYDDLRWKKESECEVDKHTGRKLQDKDMLQSTNDEWKTLDEVDVNMDQLLGELLEKSVNHIFHKDIVPQLPGNHQFFNPAIAMAARSVVEQHCPVLEQTVSSAVNDLATQAFADGALANNFKELERYAHLCLVKVYSSTSVELVRCKKDLPPWVDEDDDSYQYLLTCHRMLPNNVQGSSTLTRSTSAKATVIRVASTHDWHPNDILRILFETPEKVQITEEVQIKTIAKTEITLTEPLKHDFAVEAKVLREPRRIVDKSGNRGTYSGFFVCGRASGEGKLLYDTNCEDGEIAGKLFVGKFDRGQLSVGVVMDGDNAIVTVKDGKKTDPLNQEIASKYKARSDTANALEKEHSRQKGELKDRKRLNAMSNESVKNEALTNKIAEEDITAAMLAAWRQDCDPKQAIIDLILHRKTTSTKEIANSSAYP